MDKLKTLFLAVSLSLFFIGYGQSSKKEYPEGKAFAKIYTDFYAGLDNGEYVTAFEVKRAYLGYQSQLSEHFFAKVNLDIGSPNDQSQYALLRRYAYFKNAYAEYHNDRLTVQFGIIPIYHFKIQEKTWDHRYIYKSINDKHGLGYTADLGASIKYNISESVSADFSLTNGEGYTSLQSDDRYKVGAGITGIFNTGLMFRIYGDLSSDNVYQTTLSAFFAYRYKKKGVVGVEYNSKINDDFNTTHFRTAISGYGAWDFNQQWQIFGRYDYISGNIPEDGLIPYSLSDDGSAIIAGVQYRPINQLAISLNYQDWYPMASNAGNEHYLYLNMEIKL